MIRSGYANGYRAAFQKFALNPPTQVDEFVAKVESGKDAPPDPATNAPTPPPTPPQAPGMAQGAPMGASPPKLGAELVAGARMFEVSPGHQFSMTVPKGGSACSKCKFVSKDGKSCDNEYYKKSRGGDGALPAPADEFCCDEFTQ